MSQSRKKPKKPQNICTWIRQRTSPYDHGVKTRKGKPAHVNRNDDVRYHFQCLEAGWYGRRLSRLTNARMADHFGGSKTFYFTADGRSATPEALINIDIDCHEFGTLAGAIAFAEHLKATLFTNLYYEASTNGNGVHGYIVVAKGDLGDEGLNGALTMLDRWLKAELSRGAWDVENVEVKGHAPEFTWGMKKFELKTYKSGQLAKLPREALTRADELRGTTRFAVDELRRLPVPALGESDESVVFKGRQATKRAVVVEENPKPAIVEPDDSVVLNAGRATKKSAVVGAVKKVSGSISGHHFGVEELSKLGGSYLSVSRELMGETKLVATGRKVVTEEDLAVFLMLLKFFTNNMNADGSLPVARWREMWGALNEAGDVERAWCHHRFARMRNFLTGEGWLSWEDEDFVVGVYGDDGRFVPGKAAKWRASEELMVMMEKVEEQYVEQGAVVVDQEEKREEESILYGCKDKSDEHTEEKEEEKTILYGYTPTVAPETPPNPGQSESYFNLLDSLNLWTPIPRPRFAGYSTGQYRRAA